jgi:dCTP deaminase
MSVITKKQIVEKIKAGEIVFKPELDKFQLQNHSVDLRLGFTFMIPKRSAVTPKGRTSLDILSFDKSNDHYFDVVEMEEGQYFDLLPGEHVLVCTLETIKVPRDLMAVLYPRSSTNRRGLSLDLTGIVDSGYDGQLTLPIRNNTQSQIIRLFPGERFCQVVFETLSEPVEIDPNKKQNQDIIVGTKTVNPEESELILNGKIRQLKTDHKIEIK